MENLCESCGGRLAEASSQAVQADPDWTEAGTSAGPSAAPVAWLDEPSAHSPSARSRRLSKRSLSVGLGAVALWALLVFVARLIGGADLADTTEDPVAQVPAPIATAGPVPTTRVLATPEVMAVDGPPLSTVADGIRRVAMRSAGQADRLQRQLDRRSVVASVVYRTSAGVAIFDINAANVTEIEISPTDADLSSYAGAAVLRTGNEVVAVDLAGPTTVVLSADGSLVVTDSPDGGVWQVEAAHLGGQAAQTTRYDADGAVTMASPHAHQLEVVDGLGLVAWGKGPDDGSLVARRDGFVPLGEARLVAATDQALLQEVCSEGSCDLMVSTIDGSIATWMVPEDFVSLGDRFVLSPDARSILRIDRTGLAEVYSSVDDSVSWVIGRGMEHAVWGPDSSFVIWIDLVGEPELKAMFLDERDWVTIELGPAGAPQPVTTGLALFLWALF